MGRPIKTPAAHELERTKSQATAPGDSYIRAGRPKVPKCLSPAAKKQFRALCTTLEQRGALTPGDQQALVLYCTLFDRWSRSMDKVRAEGEVVTYSFLDKNGNEVTREKKSLHLTVAQESEKAMVAILIQLGLTVLQRDKSKPTAGGKLTTKPPKPVDELELLLGGKKVVDFPLPNDLEGDGETEPPNTILSE